MDQGRRYFGIISFTKSMKLSIIFLFLLSFSAIAKEFIQTGDAMSPTVMDGDRVEVNLLEAFINPSKRWDMVVFYNPSGEFNALLSRLVGLPGDRIDISNSGLKINGKVVLAPESMSPVIKYVSIYPWLTPEMQRKAFKLPVVLKENECFVLGDNTKQAKDSRVFGPLMCSGLVIAHKRSNDI